jgi:hypothetical protein
MRPIWQGAAKLQAERGADSPTNEHKFARIKESATDGMEKLGMRQVITNQLHFISPHEREGSKGLHSAGLFC